MIFPHLYSLTPTAFGKNHPLGFAAWPSDESFYGFDEEGLLIFFKIFSDRIHGNDIFTYMDGGFLW